MKADRSGIYTIVNTVNGRVYVGSAVNFTTRWRGHRNSLDSGTHRNPYLQRAWNKYGADKFVFTPILYCDREFLITWEQIALDGYSRQHGWRNLYNVYRKAKSMLGYRFSPEIRAKMSAAQKARNHRHSEETKAKIRASALGHKRRLGAKLSEETKQKIREAYTYNAPFKGRKHSAESLAKQRLAKLGNTNARGGKARLGQPHSEETKAKMSRSHKKRFQNLADPERQNVVAAGSKV